MEMLELSLDEAFVIQVGQILSNMSLKPINSISSAVPGQNIAVIFIGVRGVKSDVTREQLTNTLLGTCSPAFTNSTGSSRTLWSRLYGKEKLHLNVEKCINRNGGFSLDMFVSKCQHNSWPCLFSGHKKLERSGEAQQSIDRSAAAFVFPFLYVMWSPEDQAVHLVNNLASVPFTSDGSLSVPNLDFLEEWWIENSKEMAPHANSTSIFVNGAWLGIHREWNAFSPHLGKFREMGFIASEPSMARDKDGGIQFHTNAGHVCRPLLNVENQKLALEKSGIDKLEVNSILTTFSLLRFKVKSNFLKIVNQGVTIVAMTPEDLKVGGYCGTNIKRMVHSATIRGIALWGKKQWVYTTNFLVFMDIFVRVLHLAQKPLVTSGSAEYFRVVLAGTNTTVLILSYSGCNQEDSVIMNHSAVDGGANQKLIEKPTREKCFGMRYSLYYKLRETSSTYPHFQVDDSSFVCPLLRVSEEDVITNHKFIEKSSRGECFEMRYSLWYCWFNSSLQASSR
uniref:DNA-directed RNA polymerase n=1 Tax=Angiostrongylus cantonensis TaxID=6313 RepID=A0A158P626_ANGCA